MPRRVRTDAGLQLTDGAGGGATPDLFYIVANPDLVTGDQIGKGQSIIEPSVTSTLDIALAGFGFNSSSVVDIQPVGAPPLTPASLAGPALITDPAGSVAGTIQQQIAVGPGSVGIYAISVTNAAGQVGCVRLQVAPQA